MAYARIIDSEPALILEGNKKNLVISDLHIGFEHKFSSNKITIGKNSSITRADTYLRKDYPGTLETLTLGDTVSSDGDWSRAVRFAGFKWATNYKLQPGYVYTPNPIIKGSAAVPSVVDIYINNQKTTISINANN